MKPTIKPTPKQHLAWQRLQDKITRQVVFGGGAGGGKSHMGCEWILTNCFFYPGTRWFIGRDSLKSIRESTLVSWYKVLAHHKIKYEGLFKYNGQDNFFLFGNGSRVDLVDLGWYPSDPFYERFGSMEFTGGWIEEAGEVSDLAAQMISSRVGRMYNDKYNLLGKVLYTCNPKKNFLYKEFYQPWKKGELPADKAFIQSLHKDNIYGESGYEGVLQRLSGVARQRLLLGDWEYDEDANSLIEYEKILDVFRNKHMNGGVHYITVDVARKGQDTTVIGVWSGFGVKLYQYSKLLTTEVTKKVKQLQEKYLISNSNIIVDEDGVGCLTMNTKVLTIKGWRFIQDIKPGEVVYSKDVNGNVIEATVTKNEKREKTRIIKNGNVSFSFSHFLPVRTRKEHSLITKSWDTVLAKGRSYFDTDFKWDRQSPQTFSLPNTVYEMPNGGNKSLDNGINCSLKDFAALLGWFVSEGCISENKYIQITQNLNSPHCDTIESVIKSCGINSYKKNQGNERACDFMFCQKALVEWLKANCYDGNGFVSCNKRIPDLIRNADKETIDTFLQHFNYGDGHVHKGQRVYSTGSEQLSFDISECITKIGKSSTIKMKCKAGSTSKIGDRIITRTKPVYSISEFKNGYKMSGRNDKSEELFDHVYNLEIDSETRFYMVMFDEHVPFFVHNGGVVDQLRCTGFVNNSRPLPNPENPQFDVRGTLQVENFDNLRSQCYFRLADRINKGHLFVDCEEPEIIEKIIEELEWVKQKDIDSDKKKGVIPKELIKEAIGRSPDFSDTLMMRMWFELKPRFIVTAA